MSNIFLFLALSAFGETPVNDALWLEKQPMIGLRCQLVRENRDALQAGDVVERMGQLQAKMISLTAQHDAFQTGTETLREISNRLGQELLNELQLLKNGRSEKTFAEIESLKERYNVSRTKADEIENLEREIASTDKALKELDTHHKGYTALKAQIDQLDHALLILGVKMEPPGSQECSSLVPVLNCHPRTPYYWQEHTRCPDY